MTQSEESAQSCAQKRYRARLRADGPVRFEVIGRSDDRDMIRSLAKRLARESAEASRLRAQVVNLVEDDRETGAAIVQALRGSPLVGARVSFERVRSDARKLQF